MKKTYLHIGPHKTGSTYIQRSFSGGRDELSRLGLTYPSLMIGSEWGHEGLVKSIKERKSEDIEVFINSLGDLNLISSENLEYLDSDDIDFFLDLLDGHEVYVVYYKRSYSDLLVSAWQEGVKHGGVEPWSVFMLREVLRPYSSKVLGGLMVLDRWSRKTRIINTYVIGYDALMEKKVDIADYLVDMVTGSNEDHSIGVKSKINASMDLKKIEVIRVLNKIFQAKGINVNHNVRSAFLGVVKNDPKIINDVIECVKFTTSKIVLDDSWVIQLLEEQFSDRFSYENPTLINKKVYCLPEIEFDHGDSCGIAFSTLVNRIQDILGG